MVIRAELGPGHRRSFWCVWVSASGRWALFLSAPTLDLTREAVATRTLEPPTTGLPEDFFNFYVLVNEQVKLFPTSNTV